MVNGHCVLVLVYVDDVLVTVSSRDLIEQMKSDLKTRFEMTDSGKCTYVQGIELVGRPNGSATMCQRRYIDDIPKRYRMNDCKATVSSADLSTQVLISKITTKLDAPF